MSESASTLIDEFCDAAWLEDGLAKLTLEAYRRDLQQLAAWLGTRAVSLADADEEDLLAYLESRHAAGSPAGKQQSSLVVGAPFLSLGGPAKSARH